MSRKLNGSSWLLRQGDIKVKGSFVTAVPQTQYTNDIDILSVLKSQNSMHPMLHTITNNIAMITENSLE